MQANSTNLEQLTKEGKSIREISSICNMSETGIRYRLKKFGIKTKYQSFAERRTWTDEELREAVASSFTKSEVMRKLGLTVRPGNHGTITKHIKRLNLDTTHMTGRAHGTSVSPVKRKLEDVLVENSDYSRHALKKRLLKEGLLKNKCAKCGIKEWNNKSLIMVLDHINGINNDNRIENLRMLCPNCNSQTSTFCRNKPVVSEKD